MLYKSILITGGAGFVGSNLAIKIKRDFPGSRVIAFDNLKRRGSELILSRLKNNGIEFIHGDVRNKEDFQPLDQVDLIIDCSAEPSVGAGLNGSPEYLINTNLNGTINCLETARYHNSDILFLSTNRIYPIDELRSLSYSEGQTRFFLSDSQILPGVSAANGISEDFPNNGHRSIYGASKLASEIFIDEYRANFGLNTIINRCGVIAGPWQMGKVDQGFVVHWVSQHLFNGALSYFGYEGSGKQVRDVLHIDDLYDLVKIQLAEPALFNGKIFNVGGGIKSNVSLKELTNICASETKNRLSISKCAHPNNLDIPLYITDHTKITQICGWQPTNNITDVVHDICSWIQEYEVILKPLFKI